MKKQVFLSCLGSALLLASALAPSGAYAEEEDFGAILDRAKELKASGKYSEAMNELNWATQQLTKLHAQKLEQFFPAKAGEFTRKTVESNNALGMINLDGTYEKGESSIKANLIGSTSSQGGAGGGLGAFAGFAQMAAMMGNTAGTDVIRVHGKRATIQQEAGSNKKLILTLASGAVLTLEQSSGEISSDDLKTVVEAFDVKGIEAYLGGS